MKSIVFLVGERMSSTGATAFFRERVAFGALVSSTSVDSAKVVALVDVDADSLGVALDRVRRGGIRTYKTKIKHFQGDGASSKSYCAYKINYKHILCKVFLYDRNVSI